VISERKLKANRENARKSHGAATLHGRRRSARNALRHGLTLSIYTDPSASAFVESLARRISGTDNSDDAALPLARRVAEAELNVRRIRRVRHELIARLLTNSDLETEYAEQKQRAMLREILNGNFDVDLDDTTVPNWDPARKLAAILTREERALRALDRYEGRAVSRRKFAIRAFGASRRCN
jgi:hypothetical protein